MFLTMVSHRAPSLQHMSYCQMHQIVSLVVLALILFLSSSFPKLIHSHCNPSEISALLQLKNSFEIDCTSSLDPFAYPKTSSWRRNTTSKWDGVVCDPLNGHVIGLDLSSSCLYGPINSSSTIFSLVHLEHLNLAFNNFNFSNIPSQLGGLSRLSYLNLSTSYLVGWVPLEISKLAKLASLDLSYTMYMEKGLQLNLKSLIQNLTTLEELDLRYADINSEIPNSLMKNMSSLRSLKLDSCGLHGEFPSDIILHLPHLQYISISGNEKLRGSLADFQRSSRLESIKVGYTAFTGKIPNSVGNLGYLRDLDLGNCNFSGSLPASLGNLTQLVYLDLSENNFMALNPHSLSWLGKLSKLTTLSLSSINLKHEGEIPSSMANLTKLSYLSLDHNQLTGQIPYWLTNFTQLSFLSFSKNQLKGQIPPQFMNLTKLANLNLAFNNLQGSISPLLNLRNLKSLYLNHNNFNGVLELGMFLELTKLSVLQLSHNNLTLVQSRNIISTDHPNFLVLGLSSSRLSKFPEFLKNQNELIFLDLADNEIQGQLPKWMENMSVDSLEFLNISHNQITGELPLPWTYFYGLDIRFNKLSGSLPIPSPPTVLYFARNNGFSGEILPSICDLTYLRVLDLSSNYLSGELPHCFSQSSKELQILNLRNNSFRGSIPEFCKKETNKTLRMIDLNNNQFQGKLPRSLVNCVYLDFLNVGDNLINDTFPSWLGFLPRLSVMILKANNLHGPIRMIPQKSKKNNQFPLMRIIDLSYNNLSGKLPSRYFEQWIAMKNTNLSNPEYIGQSMTDYLFIGFYDYSLTMSTKGMELEYLKILDALIAIDLSSNRFQGAIPNTIGDLSGLRSLKLSNNNLSGSIPSSIGKLSQLESLDLSLNRLSAQIPQQLTQLTALSFFDVSGNNLAGKIPRGRQFDTFQNNSYLGNLGLCGQPLSRQCEDDNEQEGTPPPPEMVVEKDDDKFDVNWVTALFGFGGGLIVGVAVESMVDLRRPILSFWMRWRRRGRRRPLTRRNR